MVGRTICPLATPPILDTTDIQPMASVLRFQYAAADPGFEAARIVARPAHRGSVGTDR
jgi:hypothetical protein